MVPALLLAGNRPFGFSSNLRHLCATCLRPRADYFRYDVWRDGGWNLAFLAGTAAGALLCAVLLGVDDVPLAAATRAELAALGIRDFAGLVPDDLLSWSALVTLNVRRSVQRHRRGATVADAAATQGRARAYGRTDRPGPEDVGSRDTVLGRGHPVRCWLGADRRLPRPAGRAHRQRRHVYLVALASAIAGAWAYGWARPHLPH